MIKQFSSLDTPSYQFANKPSFSSSYYKLLQIIASINRKAKKEIIHFGIKKNYNIENIKPYPSKTKC